MNRFYRRADGTAVDMDGRIYVGTLTGVQIFDKTGVYVGNIWNPQYPVSVTFGGKNGDVLDMVGEKDVCRSRPRSRVRPPGGDGLNGAQTVSGSKRQTNS